MNGYVEIFDQAQPVSIHPGAFDVAASADRNYGSNFARDFETRMVRLEQLGHLVCQNVWSPIVFLRGHRISEDFVESAWMALDFDTPSYSLAAALEEWADSVHLIGITRNHQKPKGGCPPCDRFRVIVPWEHPITDVWTYLYNMGRLVDRYDADSACKDGGRLFYPCTKIVSVSKQGYTQPVLEAPPQRQAPPPKVYRDLGMVRRRTIIALSQPFPVFEKNNKCFECAKDLYDAGYGFEEIYRIIIDSPTYGGNVTSSLGREIEQAIKSGIKSVNQGKAYGGRQRQQRDRHQEGAHQKGVKEGPQAVGAVLSNHPEDEPPPPGAQSHA